MHGTLHLYFVIVLKSSSVFLSSTVTIFLFFWFSQMFTSALIVPLPARLSENAPAEMGCLVLADSLGRFQNLRTLELNYCGMTAASIIVGFDMRTFRALIFRPCQGNEMKILPSMSHS